jgi:hypothetical protein
MTGLLLAAFPDEKRCVAAARRMRTHYQLLDAYTPFPVNGLHTLFEHRAGRIRVPMFIGGVAMAALAYGVEYYSAAIDYPYNSGGRPFDAWPAFMLFPFATGILIAAIAGFAAFLAATGLPRLHDPLFAVAGFERASQDRFVLAFAQPHTDDDRRQFADLLRRAGASAIREVKPEDVS